LQLFAIAGGASFGGEDLFFLCGMCPILPLVILLAIVGLIRNYLSLTILAVLLVGLPIAGQVATAVLAREIYAAHVHTVSQHAGEPKASAPLAGLDYLDHLPISNDRQLGSFPFHFIYR
jgi:hypothetical protein